MDTCKPPTSDSYQKLIAQAMATEKIASFYSYLYYVVLGVHTIRQDEHHDKAEVFPFVFLFFICQFVFVFGAADRFYPICRKSGLYRKPGNTRGGI